MSQTSATTVAAVTSPNARDGQPPPHPVVAGEACPQVAIGPANLDADGVEQPQAGIQPTTSGGG